MLFYFKAHARFAYMKSMKAIWQSLVVMAYCHSDRIEDSMYSLRLDYYYYYKTNETMKLLAI